MARLWTERCVTRAMSTVREMQCIAVAYNDLMKRSTVMAFVIMSPLMLFFGVYVIIGNEEIDIVSIVVGLNAIFLGLAINLTCFTFAQKFFLTSMKVKDKGRASLCGSMFGKRRQLRNIWTRYLKSVPAMKVYLFESNFFDAGTQGNLLQFSINQVISMVLMQKWTQSYQWSYRWSHTKRPTLFSMHNWCFIRIPIHTDLRKKRF